MSVSADLNRTLSAWAYQLMGNSDTFKTAKRTIQKHEQAHDGYHDKTIKAAKKKERQKGKKIIKEEICRSKD